jgi:hypothetical protein
MVAGNMVDGPISCGASLHGTQPAQRARVDICRLVETAPAADSVPEVDRSVTAASGKGRQVVEEPQEHAGRACDEKAVALAGCVAHGHPLTSRM